MALREFHHILFTWYTEDSLQLSQTLLKSDHRLFLELLRSYSHKEEVAIKGSICLTLILDLARNRLRATKLTTNYTILEGIKLTRRSKTKYAGLKREVNLKSRQRLLDFDYLDKLSEEELEFLNKFSEEAIHANFINTTELKRLNRLKSEIINCPDVQEENNKIKQYNYRLSEASDCDLKESLKRRIRSAKSRVTKLKRRNKTANKEVLKQIESQIEVEREKSLLYSKKSEHKEFYDENNSRNRDLYTRCQNTGSLFQLDEWEIDNFHANTISLDCESALIGEMENSQLEILECEVLESLREINSAESLEYISKLNKCTNHSELAEILAEVQVVVKEIKCI